MNARPGFSRPIVRYEGKGDEGRNFDPFRQADLEMAKRVWQVLHWHYPSHCWGVSVDHQQGIVQIILPVFSDWSFVVKISDLKGDPAMKAVVRAGGEMLERWRMPRSGLDPVHFAQALKRYPDFMARNRKPPE